MIRVQLCGNLNILWHCPLGLEWKLTFSNPVATAEFSKLAGTSLDPVNMISHSHDYVLLYSRVDFGLPRWLSGRESVCQCKRHRSDPWVGKIPWRRKWQPTPVFLPGKSYGQRSLGASVQGCRRVRYDWVTEPANTVHLKIRRLSDTPDLILWEFKSWDFLFAGNGMRVRGKENERFCILLLLWRKRWPFEKGCLWSWLAEEDNLQTTTKEMESWSYLCN